MSSKMAARSNGQQLECAADEEQTDADAQIPPAAEAAPAGKETRRCPARDVRDRAAEALSAGAKPRLSHSTELRELRAESRELRAESRELRAEGLRAELSTWLGQRARLVARRPDRGADDSA